MRLYPRGLDMRACHPAEKLDRTLCQEVTTPHASDLAEAPIICAMIEGVGSSDPRSLSGRLEGTNEVD